MLCLSLLFNIKLGYNYINTNNNINPLFKLLIIIRYSNIFNIFITISDYIKDYLSVQRTFDPLKIPRFYITIKFLTIFQPQARSPMIALSQDSLRQSGGYAVIKGS
jgi:hypothetical protein